MLRVHVWEGIWPGLRVRLELGCEGRMGLASWSRGGQAECYRERETPCASFCCSNKWPPCLCGLLAYFIGRSWLTAVLPRLWRCFSFRHSNCRNSPCVRQYSCSITKGQEHWWKRALTLRASEWVWPCPVYISLAKVHSQWDRNDGPQHWGHSSWQECDPPTGKGWQWKTAKIL